MTPTALASLFAKPLAKYAIGGGLIVIAVLGFWLWLGMHDRAVRAEYYAELVEQARLKSDKAKATADAQSEIRKAQTDEVQNRIANSAGVDELFDSLRAKGGTK
jgi:hypothetical protein